MKHPLSLLLLFFAVLAPALVHAQDNAKPGSVVMPEHLRNRGGIELGLAIRDIAQANGTPFDDTLFDRRARPALGAEILRRERNFLVMEDVGGRLRQQTFGGNGAWQDVLQQLYSYYGDDFDMVMVLTEWQSTIGAAYYLPLANGVRGIGYRNIAGGDVFNQTDSNLDGLIFMNNYTSYLGRNEVLGRIVFLQEIGHRWGSFVRYDAGEGRQEDHLGRDDAHWSWFMHSQNSALEGNNWEDLGGGNFRTNTNAYGLTFSDLDLYLMGMLPPDEVAPFFVIKNADTGGQRDDYGQRLNPASPPSFRGNNTVQGTRKDITIEDVIREEGARDPDWVSSQRTWRVATIMVINENSSFSERRANQVGEMLDLWEEWFEESTRGEADLIFSLEDPGGLPTDTAGLGESCETGFDCDDASTTLCLSTDNGGAICSKACNSDNECGAGLCCASDFCYPTQDSQCQPEPDPNNNNPNNNAPNNNTPNNNAPNNNAPNNNASNNGPWPDPNNDQGNPNNNAGQDDGCSGFVDDCSCQGGGFVDDCSNSSSGSRNSGGCATAPGQSGGEGWLLVALGALGLVRRSKR